MDWESESDVGEESENNIINWESKFVPEPLSEGNVWITLVLGVL